MRFILVWHIAVKKINKFYLWRIIFKKSNLCNYTPFSLLLLPLFSVLFFKQSNYYNPSKQLLLYFYPVVEKL